MKEYFNQRSKRGETEIRFDFLFLQGGRKGEERGADGPRPRLDSGFGSAIAIQADSFSSKEIRGGGEAAGRKEG